MYDIIIRGGTIVDGTGKPPYKADLGIVGDEIASVGDLEDEAAGAIDATGLVVAPGFIDIHTHSDTSFLVDSRGESKVRQGVTTEVIGNCGLSVAPAKPILQEEIRRTLGLIDFGAPWDWESLGDYLERLEGSKPGMNVAPLVGHCPLRACAVGWEDRPPSSEEMDAMRNLVRECMEAGAFGMSSGLIYPPSMFARTEELVALCEEVASEGGIYATHIRSEGEGLLEFVREAIEIGERSGARVQISHLKAAGRDNWGKVGEALELIDGAGDFVSFDVYPYLAGSANLSQLLPPWLFTRGASRMLEEIRKPSVRERAKGEMERGGPKWPGFIRRPWSDVMISSVSTDANKRFEGMRISEIAEDLGKDPGDVVLDLIISEENRVNMITFIMCSEDVDSAVCHPRGMIGSDGAAISKDGPLGAGKPHPRYYGTFPKFLREYVRERKLLKLEEAIRKITSFPASKLGLDDRGTIAEGAKADIAIFDLNRLTDRATYEDPHRYPDGIEYVIVNGRITIDEGEHTGELSGRVLRRKGR
ncbi:MAG: N-acyl-D-amino-acid deacylase family protein [bacterium]